MLIQTQAAARNFSSAVGFTLVDAAVIIVHPAMEPSPLRTRFAVGEQGRGTIFPGPMVVRHHATEIDAIAFHEHSGQLCSAVPCPEVVMPFVFAFAHFNADRIVITGGGTCMPAGFPKRQILHAHELVNCEMPAAIRESTAAKCS